jgi:hypothetical protein
MVAFAGLAESGKSKAAKALIDLGWEPRSFGSVIKEASTRADQADLTDTLVWLRDHEPFDRAVALAVIEGFALIRDGEIDPFTEDDGEKPLIRAWLERFGEARYDQFLETFLSSLPERCVNARLVRCREAEAWRAMGGKVIEIARPGVLPATDWERDRLEELREAGHIAATIDNDGTVEELHARVLEAVHGAG